jgi:hypothetical protein
VELYLRYPIRPHDVQNVITVTRFYPGKDPVGVMVVWYNLKISRSCHVCNCPLKTTFHIKHVSKFTTDRYLYHFINYHHAPTDTENIRSVAQVTLRFAQILHQQKQHSDYLRAAQSGDRIAAGANFPHPASNKMGYRG